MNKIKDIDKLLEKLSSSGEEQVFDICLLMLTSGLRLAEIINIKFSDINFTTGTLQAKLVKRGLSNEEKIKINLNDISLIHLAKIRDKYPDNKWVFQARKSNNRINKLPQCLSSQTVMDKVRLANQHLEHKISINSFRGAYSTNYSPGMLDIKSTLGHKSINMTSKYIKDE